MRSLIIAAFLVFSSLSSALAQNTDSLISPPVNALEQQLREEMACICGTCGHEPLSKCTCGTANQMRKDLRTQVELGKTHGQIISYYVKKYGGEHFLRSPIDKGFNRLAWFFPYLIGAAGLITVSVLAKQWSSRLNKKNGSLISETNDSKIEKRLDDELRDLD